MLTILLLVMQASKSVLHSPVSVGFNDHTEDMVSQIPNPNPNPVVGKQGLCYTISRDYFGYGRYDIWRSAVLSPLTTI